MRLSHPDPLDQNTQRRVTANIIVTLQRASYKDFIHKYLVFVLFVLIEPTSGKETELEEHMDERHYSSQICCKCASSLTFSWGQQLTSICHPHRNGDEVSANHTFTICPPTETYLQIWVWFIRKNSTLQDDFKARQTRPKLWRGLESILSRLNPQSSGVILFYMNW